MKSRLKVAGKFWVGRGAYGSYVTARVMSSVEHVGGVERVWACATSGEAQQKVVG